MRVTLVYHHAAGEGVSADALRAHIERAGHRVVRTLEQPSDLARVSRADTDLVVAAGGDGTISRVARALAGRDLPLAVLPLGTANNIARTLGIDIDAPLPDVIARWTQAQPMPLDLGVARGSLGSTCFLEGIGGGLIPRGIALFDGEPGPGHDEPAAAKVERAVRRYRDVLAHLRPRTWTLTADGEPLTGDYLIVQVLNIRSVGPNVQLAPCADPSDGWFDVVIVSEEHRRELDALLEARIAGRTHRIDLPTCRARHIETERWAEMHIDDVILAGAEIASVSIDIQAAALHYLK